SSPDQHQANRTSWHNLVANLATFALDRIPVVVQYNKRDLANAVPIASADRFGEPARRLLEAEAKDGAGVVQTFFELVGLVWNNIDKDLGLEKKLGIDAQAFRRSLAEHLGIPESAG